MKLIFGFLTVTGCVFGGFVLSNGDLRSLWHPFEILIILGGASGAFIISNPPKIISAVMKGVPGLLKGNKYNKQTYMDLLSLMYALFAKARKEGLMALEADIDEPHESEIFKTYPALAKNHHLIDEYLAREAAP